MEATVWGSGGEEKEYREGRVPSKSLFLGGGALRTSLDSHNMGHCPQAGTAASIAEKAKHPGWKARLPCWQRSHEKQKWALFNEAQRGIPKGDDVGPVGTSELDSGSRKEGFLEEVALSLSPRISEGLQERTGRNRSSHGNMKETSPQEVPLWGISDGPTAAPELELAEGSWYQLLSRALTSFQARQ